MLNWLYWLWDFWVWCATINLIIMVLSDAKKNDWSSPREYVRVLGAGPIATIMFIYVIVTGFWIGVKIGIERHRAKKNKE